MPIEKPMYFLDSRLTYDVQLIVGSATTKQVVLCALRKWAVQVMGHNHEAAVLQGLYTTSCLENYALSFCHDGPQ